MRLIFIIIINLFLLRTSAQQKLSIPEFKNVNPKDQYPANTMLASYTKKFDVIISLSGYSNWGPDHNVKMLAFNGTGWYKIEINSDRYYADTIIHTATYKLDDSIGKKVWDTLKQNHLFDMSDGRIISFKCAEKIDTIFTKEGKVLEVIEPFGLGDDMPEYEFEIITKDNYKKLYFYSPQEFLNRCPTFPEPKWFVASISTFEKYLGQ